MNNLFIHLRDSSIDHLDQWEKKLKDCDFDIKLPKGKQLQLPGMLHLRFLSLSSFYLLRIVIEIFKSLHLKGDATKKIYLEKENEPKSPYVGAAKGDRKDLPVQSRPEGFLPFVEYHIFARVNRKQYARVQGTTRRRIDGERRQRAFYERVHKEGKVSITLIKETGLPEFPSFKTATPLTYHSALEKQVPLAQACFTQRTRKEKEAIALAHVEALKGRKRAYELVYQTLTLGDRGVSIFWGDAESGNMSGTTPTPSVALTEAIKTRHDRTRFFLVDEFRTSQRLHEAPDEEFLGKVYLTRPAPEATLEELIERKAKLGAKMSEEDRRKQEKPMEDERKQSSGSAPKGKFSHGRLRKGRIDLAKSRLLDRKVKAIERKIFSKREKDQKDQERSKMNPDAEQRGEKVKKKWPIYRLLAYTDKDGLEKINRLPETGWIVVHRDKNAAKNMLWLGLRQQLPNGPTRLNAFARKEDGSSATASSKAVNEGCTREF